MYIKTALEKVKTERNGKRTSKNSSPRGEGGKKLKDLGAKSWEQKKKI